MLKSRLPRFIALLGTVGVLASLVSVAVAGTGAYYTQSVAGTVSGGNGTIAITVSGNSATGDLNFDFSGILPGVAKTANVHVSNTTANTEAIWLVFDNTNGMWSGVNNLGQFGEFQVGSSYAPGGLYVYDNLANRSVPPTPGVAGAPTGSNMTFPGCETVARVPQNYLPHAIKITSLAAWGSADFPITFEYNACMTGHKTEAIFNAAGNDIGGTGGAALAANPNVPLVFNVVAFQGNADPTSPFNGSAAITNLALGAYGTSNFQYIQP